MLCIPIKEWRRGRGRERERELFSQGYALNSSIQISRGLPFLDILMEDFWGTK